MTKFIVCITNESYTDALFDLFAYLEGIDYTYEIVGTNLPYTYFNVIALNEESAALFNLKYHEHFDGAFIHVFPG